MDKTLENLITSERTAVELINKAKEEGRKLKPKDTQALILKLKKDNPNLNKVYSKVLQMVNYQLWSNIKALAKLKQNGKKTGKLRYKGKGWFKTLNFNQSGFEIDFENNNYKLNSLIKSQKILDIFEDLDYDIEKIKDKLFSKIKDNNLKIILTNYLNDNGYLKTTEIK